MSLELHAKRLSSGRAQQLVNPRARTRKTSGSWLRLLIVGLALISSPASWDGSAGSPTLFAAESLADVINATSNEAVAASRQRMAEDLQYLSSDELKGRDTGSEGIEKAAEYIAERFQSLGFNTELYDGKPFQRFVATRQFEAGAGDDNRLNLSVGDFQHTYTMDETLRPLALGGSGQVTAPLVFAGYGITAPEKGYDDYAGIDVEGKIVIVLRGEPRSGRDDNPLGGRRNSRFAFFTTKVENAQKHGAAALLIVNHASGVEEEIAQTRQRLETEKKRLLEAEENLAALPEEAVKSQEALKATIAAITSQIQSLGEELNSKPEGLLGTNQAGQTTEEGTIPVAALGRRAFAGLLAEVTDGERLEAIEAGIDAQFQPHSFVLDGSRGELSVSVVSKELVGKNVIAELPGRGELADETIVIGAHYDHVGMGGAGSLAPGTIAVHNGADDNGSGTVAMLETAHRLAQLDVESRRRIVFIAFSAEEKGLLGSKHYAREPRFDMQKTTAMINLDMVGRLNDEEQLTVFGTGTSPEFDGLVDQWTEKFGLPVRKDESGYGPSDHTSFYEEKVPVLFFFTGLHTDYHRPTDDFEKINLDGMVRITDMVCEAAVYLATVPERPKFQTTGPGEGVHRRTAYLGVMLSDEPAGVVITQVPDGGPAKAAGLQVGDRIISVGGEEMTQFSQVQAIVRGRRPGDELSMVIQRGNQQLSLQVKLGRK